MKMTAMFGAAAAGLLLVGCASDDHRHRTTYYHHDGRPDVVVEQRDGSRVVIDSDADRIYVRDRDDDRDSGYHPQSAVMPRHRGKHADALGWNDPEWYHDRRY
jgi:hypothetical protein